MTKRELRRLRAFQYARKHAFQPAVRVVSRRESKVPRLIEKNHRKKIAIEFKDYLSAVAIQYI